MTADESNPTPRRRKQRAPHVIDGSAKVLAEEPVPGPTTDPGSAPPETPPIDPSPETQPSAAPSPEPAISQGSSPETAASESNDSAPRAAAEAVASRRPSRLFLYAASGILLGLVVAGVAWFSPFGSSGPTPGAEARASAIDAKLAALEQSVATLDKRVGAAEASGRQMTETVASEVKKLANTNTNLVDATNAAKAASQAAQADATRALTMGEHSAAASGANPVDLQSLQDRIARLETALAQPKVEGKSTADRIAAIDANLSLDHAAAIAVVAQTLIQAIDRGEPFPQQVATIDNLGADAGQVSVLKPLAETGVPSARSLSQKFTALAGPIAASGSDAKDGDDFFGRVWHETARLIRVRPLGETSGNDPGALVARIEAVLARSDTASALAAWEKLPASARSLSQKWADELKSRIQAEAAASAILTSAIANLGKPKS